MKNRITLLLGTFAVALVLAVLSSGQLAAEDASKSPRTGLGIHTNLDYYGMKPKRIVSSGAAAQLLTGEAFLDAICAFGGTPAKYSMAFDTGVSAQQITVDSLSLALSPPVYTAVDTLSVAINDLGYGCWAPKHPIKIVNGLVGVQNDAGHTTIYYVHESDGSNPGDL